MFISASISDIVYPWKGLFEKSPLQTSPKNFYASPVKLNPGGVSIRRTSKMNWLSEIRALDEGDSGGTPMLPPPRFYH